MMNPFRFLFFLSALAAVLPLSAQATDATERSRFQILTSTQSGEPQFKLIFRDGREAELQLRRSGSVNVPLTMNMTETLCLKNPPLTQCQLSLPIETFQGELVWTKHPDTSKVGQEVLKQQTNNGQVTSTPAVSTPLNYTLSIEDVQRLGQRAVIGSAQFSCNHYRWLTGRGDESLPPETTVEAWSSEINTSNFETGFNENLTFSGGFQVHMTALASGGYQIDRGQFYYAFPILALISTGPSTLITRDSAGELCQTTFSMEFAKALKIAQELGERAKTAPLQRQRLPMDLVVRVVKEFQQWDRVLASGQEYLGVIP